MFMWSGLMKAAQWMRLATTDKNELKERQVMKRAAMVGLVAAGLLMSGAAANLFAQVAPCNGRGYGGPPKSDEERAARQAACLEKNGGICPNGGPRTNCPAYGQGGQGKGNGKCARQGLRDGTGPRSANGTCPPISQTQAQK